MDFIFKLIIQDRLMMANIKQSSPAFPDWAKKYVKKGRDIKYIP